MANEWFEPVEADLNAILAEPAPTKSSALQYERIHVDASVSTLDEWSLKIANASRLQPIPRTTGEKEKVLRARLQNSNYDFRAYMNAHACAYKCMRVYWVDEVGKPH